MRDLQTQTNKPAVRVEAVDDDTAGQRLDNFLLARLKGVPRSHVYRLIRSGQVRVNSGRSSASCKLEAGDRVRIPPVRHAQPPRAATTDTGGLQWLEERIVYEDARLIVLDKPAGLAVHGGSGIQLGCIEALRSLRPKVKALELVHRLDRATSGCLLVAKKRSALRSLHELLREGGVEKHYLALVKGLWEHGNIEIDAPLLARRHAGEVKVRVAPDGKAARSRFKRVDAFGRIASLVDVHLLTGRTHQIRVHATHAGAPIAGDERYGDSAFNETMRRYGLERMFLHAHSIAFTWPGTDEELMVNLPLPPELSAVIDRLQTPRRR